MVTLRASQGQRKWGNRSEQQMKTATSVSVSVSVRLRVCVDAAVAAAVSRGWHFSFKSLRIEKRRDAPGRETSHFQLERRWEEPVTEAGERDLPHCHSCTSASWGSEPKERPRVGWLIFFFKIIIIIWSDSEDLSCFSGESFTSHATSDHSNGFRANELNGFDLKG